MKRLRQAALVTALATALAGPGAAADFDGSKALLCVAQEALECVHAEGCTRLPVEELGIPAFMRVDFDRKRLGPRGSKRSEDSTAIQNVQKVDGKTILQGAERGRGWSMVIDQDDGRMSASVAEVTDDGNRHSFVLFGACTVE